MPRSPQEVYARLLSSPRGYPLWTPEPSHELLMQRRDGFRIGDVGVVTDDGGFDVLFNICLPRDHSFHRPHGVPEGFTYIDPSGLDIRTIPNAERHGGIVSTASVTRVETNELSGDGRQRHGSSALSYRFTLSSSEGALLILPKGAERRDLLDEGLFREQASVHGEEWYNYAVNRRHRIISHDSLYLLTGFYKTRSWSVAAFDHDSEDRLPIPAHFKHIDGDITASSYTWETARPLDWRAGPHIDYDIPNQTVFIRGFKIAMRRRFLGTRRWVSVKADVPSTRHNPLQSSSTVLGASRLLDAFAGLSLGPEGTRIPRAAVRHDGSVHSTEGQFSRDVPDDSTLIEIQRVPDTLPVFHPSDAINKYLLQKNPSANIAITHDSDWITILENDPFTLEQLGGEGILEKVLSQHFHVILRERVVHLKRKSLQQTKVPVHTTVPPGASIPIVVEEDSGISIMELPRSIRSDREILCGWIQHGQRCDTRVPKRDFPTHFRTVHLLEFDKKQTLMCRWERCGEELKDSLDHVLEHIRVRHLRCDGILDCPDCGRIVASELALQRHLEDSHTLMPSSQRGQNAVSNFGTYNGGVGFFTGVFKKTASIAANFLTRRRNGNMGNTIFDVASAHAAMVDSPSSSETSAQSTSADSIRRVVDISNIRVPIRGRNDYLPFPISSDHLMAHEHFTIPARIDSTPSETDTSDESANTHHFPSESQSDTPPPRIS